ncbi:hypothetical protein T06_2546 [Trichinella sp. T6]|nr:hypothetical protein T06_2546 [Trichinella sp. T6]
MVSGLRSTSKAAALLIKAWDLNPYVTMSLSVHKQDCWHQLTRHKGMDGKQLFIPVWYNLECTIHAPALHGCQSNVVTRSKYQYVPRCTLPQ